MKSRVEVADFELNMKMTVMLPQYFEWFILDFVGAQDLVERNTALLGYVTESTMAMEELKFKILRSSLATEQQISLRYVDIQWEMPNHLSNAS